MTKYVCEIQRLIDPEWDYICIIVRNILHSKLVLSKILRSKINVFCDLVNFFHGGCGH